MKTTFKKQADWFNPMFVNGKEIYTFRVFSTATTEYKNIIGSFRWLSLGCNSSNNCLKSFTINAELKNKRKHDFSGKTKLFIITEKVHRELVNIVYIHSSLLNIDKQKGKALNYNNYSVDQFNCFIRNLEFEAIQDRAEHIKKLGFGFTQSGEKTQTEKQKSHEKIENLFREKFGNKVPSYYMGDLAKFFKKHSRLANKAELK